MDFLKELFGADGKTKLDFDELAAAVKVKGFDVVDLTTGNYVDKKKHDRIAADRDTQKQAAADAAAALKKLQDSGVTDEATKAQIKKLEDDLAAATASAADATKKLTQRTQLDAALDAVKGDKKLAKLLRMEASEFVNEDVDFETAMAKVMKDQPDVYTIPDDDDGSGGGTTVRTPGGSNEKTPKSGGATQLDADVRQSMGLPAEEN